MGNPALTLLGLVRRGGNLAMGEAPVAEACQAKKAGAVLLASNAGESTCRRGRRMAEQAGVPLIALPWTKEEVGFQLGRATCALLAPTDLGLTSALVQQLARQDEALRPLAQQLAEKAQRRLARRGKKKNKQAGKRPAVEL